MAALLLLAGAAFAEYPASKHGGNYMFSYYLPPPTSTTPWAPTWSPDGKWIAVALYGSIWKVDPQTGTAFELTYNRKYQSSPAWSPDGKWIVYTADDDGRTIQLEIVNVASGESHALTTDAQLYTDPVFSPDGSRLAYVSTRPRGYFNLYVRPIRDGRWAGEEIAISQDHSYGKDRLYFGPWDMHIEPAWMPDSQHVVCVSNRGAPLGSGDVWRVPVEARGMEKATRILREETLYRTRPDVSRDGKLILFSSSRGAADQFNHLYLVPTAGGEPYKLTFGEYDDFHPRWSPDGQSIAYISNNGGLPQLWLLETWGGAKKQVTITSLRWKRPMGYVRARVVDASSGARTAARIYAPASDGKLYAPRGEYSRIASGKMTYRPDQHIFHTDGEFRIEVPSGKMTIQAVKGFAYRPASQEVEVRAGELSEVTLSLQRMIDMGAKGWYSGSTHVHMNYAGNLHNTLENMLRMARAEDVDVLNVLPANKDSRVFDHQFFAPGGGAHPLAKNLIVGQEYRPPFWGHVFYIGLRDHLISPFTAGYQGSALESLYPSNTDMFRKAIAQGAAVGYVHAFSGDRDPLEGNLGGAKGFPVDLALGTVHALEWSSSSRATMLVWQHAMNNDFPVAPVGGEDSITNLHRQTMVGAVRTYAYMGSDFSARAWITALQQGQTFFSNGPILEFRVNDAIPGEAVHLPAGGGTIHLSGRVWSWQPTPRVLVYRNGKVWKEVGAAFDERVEVAESGWYSLYAEGKAANLPVDPSYPQAGTNAIRVYVGDKKIRNRESAEYFLRWLTKLRSMAAEWPGWRSQAEKDHVFAQFDEARRIYEARTK